MSPLAATPRWVWPVALACVLVSPAVALGALELTGGLDQPGVRGWKGGRVTTLLVVSRAVHDVAAAVCIGLLVVVATVLSPGGGPAAELGGVRARAVRYAAVAGATWVGASAAVLALTYLDVAGATSLTALAWDELRFFVGDFELGRALAASLLLAALATSLAVAARRITTAAVAAVVALAALLPLALGGHSASASRHDYAVDTQAAHLVGVSVWVGGLVALVLLRRDLGEVLGEAVRRYSRLAGWCFGLVAVSGVAAALTRLDGWSAWRSDYGLLLAGKVIALAALGSAAGGSADG